jgi:hypothetical protein
VKGITWLNRELEWAGLAPALFSRELGVRGRLGAARREVRSNRGNLDPLVSVITQALIALKSLGPIAQLAGIEAG